MQDNSCPTAMYNDVVTGQVEEIGGSQWRAGQRLRRLKLVATTKTRREDQLLLSGSGSDADADHPDWAMHARVGTWHASRRETVVGF